MEGGGRRSTGWFGGLLQMATDASARKRSETRAFNTFFKSLPPPYLASDFPSPTGFRVRVHFFISPPLILNMYADRLEADNHRSIKDRLNGNSSDLSARRRPITGKRQRQDDKWEHDLYENDEPQTSNRRVGARDLRLKLQKKSQQQSGNAPFSGVRDLREKLSGTMKPQAAKNDPPKPKLEVTKPPRKNDAIEAHPSTTQKAVAKSATRKNAAQKSDTSVDDFLQSLGLEKYSITFQAEEVDMTALVHMGDDDLKALGVPMLDDCQFLVFDQRREMVGFFPDRDGDDSHLSDPPDSKILQENEP
ncbi:ankyrin repeat and SAM domain-containing protein 6 [Cucumis melo var. makuwa]|uniref:Ankyrin repeat and SAM domain-containing protein 6 n=1 Tax=Cucumis melo var. makuwa TaxID=1194695 RepID=A0A5D3E3V8_CUCMM|nr:ankyrin repeat and SAM domain-containing protein 6 [Cucumis melo var. makuwa]